MYARVWMYEMAGGNRDKAMAGQRTMFRASRLVLSSRGEMDERRVVTRTVLGRSLEDNTKVLFNG